MKESQPHILNYLTLYVKWADEVAALGDKHEAVRLLERLCELYPSLAEAWTALAKMLDRSGDAEGALATALKAIKLDPLWLDAVIFACQLYRKAQQVHQAKDLLKHYLAACPPTLETEREMALILSAEGDLQAAFLQQLAIIRRQGHSISDIIELLLTSLKVGLPEESRALFQQVTSAGTIPPALLAKLLPYCGAPEYMHLIQPILTESHRAGTLTPDLLLGLADTLKASGYTGVQKEILRIGTQAFVDGSISEQAERELPLMMPKGRAQTNLGTKKRIVFVSDRPKIREAKMAAGLRKLGWEVILLHKERFNGDPLQYFDHAEQFETPNEAVFLSSRFGADLFHVFSAAVDDVALAMLRHRPGKIILDVIDVFDGMLYDHPRLMPAQRYCLQNADALVSRDLQPIYAARRGKYSLPKQRLFFPEYCWGLPRLEQPRQDDEIHLVQVGYVDIPRKGEVTELGYVDMFTKLVEGGVHVHMYKHMLIPGKAEEYFSDFFELGHRTGRMHVHDTVPVNAVHNELCKYDIGINATAHSLTDQPIRRTKHDANIGSCGSARNTDYMDALLPIITTSNMRFQNFLLRRYSLVINLTRELLISPRTTLARFRGPEVREYLRLKRQPFTIDAQTWRLAEFYERVRADKSCERTQKQSLSGERSVA